MMREIIGITGMYASGKDTASEFFRDKGFDEINVDLIGHEVLIAESDRVIEIFGQTIVDDEGVIDRTKLGSIVFGNTNQLKLLTGLIYPLMRQRIEQILSESSGNLVINAAVLYEMGINDLCTRIIYIDCEESLLIKRGILRDGSSAAEVVLKLSSQKGINSVKKYADVVIENSYSLEDFKEKLKEFYITYFRSDSDGRANSNKKGNVYPES